MNYLFKCFFHTKSNCWFYISNEFVGQSTQISHKCRKRISYLALKDYVLNPQVKHFIAILNAFMSAPTYRDFNSVKTEIGLRNLHFNKHPREI